MIKLQKGWVPQVAPEFDEVVQSVSEAAHSRFIKLLAARCSAASLPHQEMGQKARLIVCVLLDFPRRMWPVSNLCLLILSTEQQCAL